MNIFRVGLCLFLSFFVAVGCAESESSDDSSTTIADADFSEEAAPDQPGSPVDEGDISTGVDVFEDGLVPEDADTTVTVVVDGEGKAQVADGSPSIAMGDVVLLEVSSAIVEEVHVHTYDISAAVGPESPARILFTASIPGSIEVELEESGAHIAHLNVR